MRTIDGHPSTQAQRVDGPPIEMTLCASCEQLRTVLFLSGDRWFCTNCRAEGDARPTMIPMNAPRKR